MGDLGPLDPNKVQLLMGVAEFFLIFGVLSRVLLPRVERILAERHEATEGRLERAEQDRAEAERTLTRYRRELMDAHHEAARIRQEAAEEGAALVAAARAEGQRERDQLVSAARTRIAVDRALAEVELRDDVRVFAVDLAERVVGEPLAEFAARRGTVERFFAER